MARIRTIKPEFPHSESLGRCSRDARLCFVNLWTQSDDSGRVRGNSRMLASLLFPYDDDAPGLIERWLGELEACGCIRRYEVDGNHYLDIPKWLEHQKIDKPSPSRLPQFVEGSSKPREVSSGDLGREGKGKDLGRDQEGTSIVGGADPFSEAVAEWNDFAKELGLSVVLRQTRERRSKFVKYFTNGHADDWPAALAAIRASPFCQGKNDRKWKADFDFLLTPAKLTKLLEGKYRGELPEAERIRADYLDQLEREEADLRRLGDGERMLPGHG